MGNGSRALRLTQPTAMVIVAFIGFGGGMVTEWFRFKGGDTSDQLAEAREELKELRASHEYFGSRLTVSERARRECNHEIQRYLAQR